MKMKRGKTIGAVILSAAVSGCGGYTGSRGYLGDEAGLISAGRYGAEAGGREIRPDTSYSDAMIKRMADGTYEAVPLKVYVSDFLGTRLTVDEKSGEFVFENGHNMKYKGSMRFGNIDRVVIGNTEYGRSDTAGSSGLGSVFSEGDRDIAETLMRFGIY